MAPSPKEIENALIDGTVSVFSADPDSTTVNKVRKHVEEQLSLEEGYLTNEKWKSKSKSIIKEYVDKLLEGWKPEKKQDAPKSKPEENKPSPAKNKDAKKPKSQESKSAKKQSPPSDDSDGAKNKNSKNKRKRKSDSADVDTDDSGSDKKPVVDEEEEYSDVIDEPAPTKRKKKEPKSPIKAAAKPAAKKASSTAPAPPDDPDEAEIKKLQSQLVKCGIRKLWHNELKDFGDDARAKIRHLRKMLSDAGMDGRFSEAKAREIRETRELLAEAEAAQEMNRLWGMDKGGRASRSKGKSLKEDSDSESPEVKDAESDDDDAGTSFAARRRRAQADLAFLGSDSDSD